MSVYGSMCHDHEHQFDVAYSMLGNDVRIIIWKDEDSGTQAQMNLSDVETGHLIDVLQDALERSRR